MVKRLVLATAAVFVVWSVLDVIVHGLFLQSDYEATADLWRPMGEMKMGLMRLVTLIFSAAFAAIYGFLVAEKSLVSGAKYGILFGLATGTTMGFGSYSYMPIPAALAWSWFFAALFKALIGGTILGVILRR